MIAHQASFDYRREEHENTDKLINDCNDVSTGFSWMMHRSELGISYNRYIELHPGLYS